ncbi:hypothetical protein [Paraflavitalea speifideaquila]|uniref:hypothetical protein n=1 Tax=Paraflavitalea speifideaquila TaxID=3076558 RepID=UPI0028E747F4|nr:hypothetical protein [Paraflavitalea speifideiaquila]
MRENIRAADDLVVFPLGSHAHQYTPAAIRNRSITGDDFYVTVFDSVKSMAINGTNLVAESVNKTWEKGKRLQPNMGR